MTDSGTEARTPIPKDLPPELSYSWALTSPRRGRVSLLTEAPAAQATHTAEEGQGQPTPRTVSTEQSLLRRRRVRQREPLLCRKSHVHMALLEAYDKFNLPKMTIFNP